MTTFHVVLIEDDPDHASLISDLLEDDCPGMQVTHHGNGPAGLEFLELCYAQARLPDLILLDLNMPGLNGVEVMRILKSDRRFVHIPAVLLTTSSSPVDVEAALAAHANSYVCKAIDLTDFEGTIETLRHYWRSVHCAANRAGRANEA
ncbi:MAG: response regulator [Pseudomonadota bacterium]